MVGFLSSFKIAASARRYCEPNLDMEENMTFRITERTDLSLADLVNLYKRGSCVIKTPHVGNAYPNNLAVAHLGLPLLLVDHTIGIKDKNFHPHMLIARGASQPVADPQKLTANSKITNVPNLFAERFKFGASLSKAHTQSLRDACPNSLIETSSEHTRRLANEMLPYLEVLTKYLPGSWNRLVSAGGEVIKRFAHRPWSEIQNAGVLGLSDNSAGWIIPNAWNILADGVFGYLHSGCATIYTLSGPDMIRYYPKLLKDIQHGYEALRTQLWTHLPEDLELVMVPVADMRFVTTQSRASKLDALVESYLRLDSFKRLSGQRIAQAPSDKRSAFINELATERNAFRLALIDAIRDCPEIFYRIEDASYLSQYDLLLGEHLYVHPWAIEAPLKDIMNAMRILEQFHSSV